MGALGDFLRLEWRFHHLKGPALAAFQDREIRRLLEFARCHSPWYAGLLGTQGPLPPFHSLPEMDKTLFMREFDRLNTRGLQLASLLDFALDMEQRRDFLHWYQHREGPRQRQAAYSVGLSSGTSGNKGLTVTPASLARHLPAVFAARGGLPLSLLPFRVLFILRVDNQAFKQINSPLVTLGYAHSMTSSAQLIRQANVLRATVLMGPPSVLRLLAPLASGLDRPPRLVVSIAEVLHPQDRQRLEAAFGCPVHQIYQTTEGPIASCCVRGSLHINEDLMYVELLDDQGQPVTRPGQRSARMLVTNLYNDVHPLVRYRMGDQVILGGPCACGSGFRVIQEIVGRDDDVLWLLRRDGRFQPVFPDLFSRWIISHSDAILEFQVTQDSPHRLVLRLRLDPAAPDAASGPAVTSLLDSLAGRIRRELATWDCGAPDQLDLHLLPESPPEPAGGAKFKRFVRTMPEPPPQT